MTLSLAKAASLAGLLGVGVHLGYFIRGEHHTSNLRILFIMLCGPPALFLYLSIGKGLTLFQAVQTTVTIVGAFVTSLTTSILIYRYFFHALKTYPGPAAARLSKFWQVKKTIYEYQTFQLLDELHATYGDWVRTGPNEISVIDPRIVDAVHSPQSKCRKSPWYDQSLPITSLQQLRDRTLHDKRRRGGWDKAFNTRSLRAYDTRVIGLADLLVQQINTFNGTPLNATEWFNFYSYDVMGSLGFGRSFDTLKTGGSHRFMEILKSGMIVLKAAGPITYLLNIASRIPLDNPIRELNLYSEKCVAERKRNEKAEEDILGHLIEAEEFFGDSKLDHMLLLGDSRLVIVAGSDTTAAALAYVFYYIAKDPKVAAKIRIELKENGIRNDETFTVAALQNLTYLNGVMNESLRLHPPVPSGVFRTTPPEGLQVGEKFIPGNVNVLVPTYTLQRSSKCFVHPESFIPERWGNKSDLIISKNAFLPFSTGPYGCIGKHLAMGEIRTVIAKILLEFDVMFAPNEDGTNIFERQRDNFTLNPGKLELCFVRRDEYN